MRIKFPIVITSEKEMWEREEIEMNAEKLQDLGFNASNAAPFEHSDDRLNTYAYDMEKTDMFYQTYVYYNDIEMEAVKVQCKSGYWPPAFAVPFVVFEKLYIMEQRGFFLKLPQHEVMDYKEVLELLE